MDWMILPFRRYFDFSGRSRRREYWLFTLFVIIVSLVLGLLDDALGLTFGAQDGATSLNNNGVLGTIFSLATLIPSIAVGVRRLHDTNRTGWWILFPVLTVIGGAVLGLVLVDAGSGGFAGLGGLIVGIAIGAIIGGLVLFVFYVSDGTPGPNRFDDDPKDPVGDVADVFR